MIMYGAAESLTLRGAEHRFTVMERGKEGVVKTAARIAEGTLFIGAAVLAVVQAVIVGGLFQYTRVHERSVWLGGEIFQIDPKSFDWVWWLLPFVFIAPTMVTFLVALALWAGWPAKWRSRGSAWVMVAVANLVLFVWFFIAVALAFGDGPQRN